MLNFLSKTAGILSNVDSPSAKQAGAALNGILMAHAARRSPVMTPEEVLDFNVKLKDFLDSTLGNGKIPRGLKWRLLQLKDGHAQLVRQLAKLEMRKARGESPMVPAEPQGETTPVEMPGEITQADQSWADIVDEAERERKLAPAPVELPPLARKQPEPIEGLESTPKPELSRKPMVSELTPDELPKELAARKQPDVKVLSPSKVDSLVGKTPAEQKKHEPQGTHAETWDERIRRWLGKESKAELLSDMIKVANKLDVEGYTDAADIIERVVIAAADQYPSLNETRKDLYDFKAHNQETMREVTKKEVEENSKNHHLDTHQGVAVSQTRYSPDMPGVMMVRVSDGVYRDPITNKLYDFQHGFTDASGNARSGGSIKHQTPMLTSYAPPSRIFEGVLSRRK